MLHTLTLAAATPTPGIAAEGGLVATVWELTWKGGVVMIPIVIASLVAITFAIERAIVLRRERVAPQRLLAEVLSALPGHPARSLDACRSLSSPLARVLESGVRAWHRSAEEIEKRLIEAGLREAVALRSRLKVLSFVVGVAPMLGLLGTIFGMITAFRTVASSPDALGRTELLAGGIYQALVTTAAGLLVAIPVMLLYWLLSAMADRRLVELDSACRSLLDRHPSSGLASPATAEVPAPSAVAEPEPAMA